MFDADNVLRLARSGYRSPLWMVFVGKRFAPLAWVRGTLQDPDPLLVCTPEGVVEYVNSKHNLSVVDFFAVRDMEMKVSGSSSSNSTLVTITMWIDIHSVDGRKARWSPKARYDHTYPLFQSFLMAFGMHWALYRHRP
jgi:hypothetical protein